MKLKAIKKIKITKAASFKDYAQDFDFEKINVFFGYNGCGKTTLSRTLCCLEKKEIIDELKTEDIETPLFSINTEDKSFSQNDLNNDLKIKVFNQDYVSKNINYDNLTGILIAGEKSQDKQNKIIELTKKKESLQGEIEAQGKNKGNLESKIDDLNLKIESQKSQVSKFIKDRLKGFDNSYDKRKLDDFKNKQEFKTYETKTIDLEKEIQNYNSTNKQNIDVLEMLKQITEDDIENIKTILQSSVLDSVQIPEITAEFEKWASDGLELHKDKNQCVFCGSSLTEERKKALNSHFSDEYKNLIKKIDSQIDTLKTSRLSKIEKYFDWYEEFREEGEKQKKAVNDKITDYNKYLSEMIAILEKKKKNAFNTDFKVDYKDFDLDISKLNNLIEKHREKHQNFETAKNESANKVITYKIVEMEKSTDFVDKQNSIEAKKEEIGKLNGTIKALSDEISTTETEIKTLSKEIHELQIGADKFNQYLDELLPSLGLKVEPNGDNFTLKRNKHHVKHLSEGERNVLSFVYFVLSFSDGKDKKNELKDDLKDWIVFIDDPISSLDDSNLHLVAGFIKNHFKHTKQLFLTTHNFSFWRCFRNSKQYSGYSHFLIEKKKGNSIILELDKEHVLVKHQSDYTFIYSKLKEFTEKPEAEENVTVLNHLRKFLEYFSSFMYPNNSGVDIILETLLQEDYKLSPDIESFIVYRLSNEGSHMQTRTDFISKNPVDISENIQKVLKVMEEKYPEHIKSLENKEETT
jgi:wobble nucleotide-excising tRNase